MANMLQSSQTQATQAPGFYTDYLSNLATRGQQAAGQAQYVGAQPLQTQAFCAVATNFGAAQPAFQTGQGYVGQAAGQNVTGAAAPYLQAGTSVSPLSAMTPYAQNAMCTTAYEAGMPLVAQGSGLSGLTAASPFLGRASGICGACVSGQYVNQATQLDMTGAAQPYLQQAATSGGLNAANPYLQQAVGTSPAELAAQYMNPYLNTAVQSMSDIAQRNIRNNLLPSATAAAVGSGQFGSQRGAQVLGQIQAQAQQDLNNQIAQMMSQGYGQALCAASRQNALAAQAGSTAGTLAQQQASLLGQLGQTSGQLTGQQMQNLINAGNVQGTLTQQQANLLGQLGSTAGSLTNQTAQNLINAGSNLGNLQQNANQIAANLGSTAANAQAQQNQANLTAAQTASQAAANQGQLLNAAGLNMGTLGTGAANTNLACINALATLGGQQQTIGQNAQNFPLTNLASLSNLLQGYSIPTSTQTTLCMSPFSAAAALGSGGLGLIQAQKFDSAGNPISGSSIWNQVLNQFRGNPATTTTANSGPSNVDSGSGSNEISYAGTDSNGNGLYWNPSTGGYQDVSGNSVATTFDCFAAGGKVQSKAIGGMVGGLSCQVMGGMPPSCSGMQCNAGNICTPYMAKGGIAKSMLAGRVGCASTQYRGGLPYKG